MNRAKGLILVGVAGEDGQWWCPDSDWTPMRDQHMNTMTGPRRADLGR